MSTFNGSDKAIAFLFDMVANIADDYDETSTYSVNDYVIHEGVLYKCTSNIIVAEDFTPAHWVAVLVMDEISAGGGGGGSTTLAGLSDVALSSVANNDVLTYDSTLGKWKNAAGGGGGGGSIPDELYVQSILIYKDRASIASTTKSGFFALTKDEITPYTPPTGYKFKYRVSASLNTRQSNFAEIYLNSELIMRKSTWIQGVESTFLGHYSVGTSYLFDIDSIAKEYRYMGGGTQDYYNFYLASTNTQTAYCENVMLHIYQCKETS